MIDQRTWDAGYWLNEPRDWRRGPDGSVVIVANPRTDFWRLTHDGGARHTGHAYGIDVSGDFTAVVAVRGSYVHQYDQAGLIACADESLWLKAGVEFFEGSPRLSAVVTRETSDWALGQIAAWETVWIRLQRMGRELAVSFSSDGTVYALARQCTLTDQKVQVGLLCCAPGDYSFTATFSHFSITV